MILTEKQRDVTMIGIPVIKTFNMAVNAKSYKILSANLYKNPLLAIIREYSCNAYDAHVAAGKSDVPFEVHLPTEFVPSFIVKDYGTGLNPAAVKEIDDGKGGKLTRVIDETMELFTTFFESTKTESNDFTGALGLGSKSAFAVTEQFTVKNRWNGKIHSYFCFIDSNGTPSIAPGPIDVTDEPNGVEIIIPIAKEKVQEMINLTCRFFFLWPYTLPKIFNLVAADGTEIHSPTINISGEGWFTYVDKEKARGARYARMGNVAYEIDTQQLTGAAQHANEKDRAAFHVGVSIDSLVMDFAMGDLEFAPSRESLMYDDRTVNALLARFIKIGNHFINKLAIEFDAIDGSNYFELKQNMCSFFRNATINTSSTVISSLKSVKAIFERGGKKYKLSAVLDSMLGIMVEGVQPSIRAFEFDCAIAGFNKPRFYSTFRTSSKDVNIPKVLESQHDIDGQFSRTYGVEWFDTARLSRSTGVRARQEDTLKKQIHTYYGYEFWGYNGINTYLHSDRIMVIINDVNLNDTALEKRLTHKFNFEKQFAKDCGLPFKKEVAVVMGRSTDNTTELVLQALFPNNRHILVSSIKLPKTPKVPRAEKGGRVSKVSQLSLGSTMTHGFFDWHTIWHRLMDLADISRVQAFVKYKEVIETPIDIDIDNDAGYYIIVDREKYLDMAGLPVPRSFKEDIDIFLNQCLEYGNVYTVTPGVAKKLKPTSKLRPVWELRDDLKKKLITKIKPLWGLLPFINSRVEKNKSFRHAFGKFQMLMNVDHFVIEHLMAAPRKSPILRQYNIIAKLAAGYKIEHVIDLYRLVTIPGLSLSAIANEIATTHSKTTEAHKLFMELDESNSYAYPMLKYVGSYSGTTFKEDIAKYIQVVDNQK